jgi:hypothetical protein
MARRKSDNQLDRAIELWAIWCYRGQSAAAGKSMLARLIDNKGELMFSGSGGRSFGCGDDLESSIESCVNRMFQESPIKADVLRLEYGVGDWEVVQRRKIGGYDFEHAKQLDKALFLGVSYATYRRHLAAARLAIEAMLGGAT